MPTIEDVKQAYLDTLGYVPGAVDNWGSNVTQDSINAIYSAYGGGAASASPITAQSGTLDAALQSVVNDISTQQDYLGTVAESQADLARQGSALNMAETSLGYDIQRENAQQGLQQFTLQDALNLAQALQSGAFSRDQAIANAELTASQAKERAGLSRSQTKEGGKLSLDQALRALGDFLTKGLENVALEEKEGLRKVAMNALDRGVYRSGIREAGEGRVIEAADLERKHIQMDFNRETDAANARFVQLTKFADESFQLTSKLAMESLANAKMAANGAFDLMAQQAREDSALAMQFAQEDFNMAMQHFAQLEHQAMLRNDYELQNALNDIAINYQTSFNNLEAQRAQEEAALYQQQANLETAQAQYAPAPGSPSGSSGGGVQSATSPAVTPYYPSGASVPSGGATIDALRAAAGIPGYSTGSGGIPYTTTPTNVTYVAPKLTYTPPSYDAGPAVSAEKIKAATTGLQPVKLGSVF